jgi:hypothetical protein
MARKQARPQASHQATLDLVQKTCRSCGSRLQMARHGQRKVTTLEGVYQLTIKLYRCPTTQCPRFHQMCRPEEEGGWALPHGEFGLDVIALVGTLRYGQQRSIAQIHEELKRRGVTVAERTVTDQLYRYEELLALHLADQKRLQQRLQAQKQVILSLDGLQPDVGHEVLWVLRDCCSGEVLLARSLLGAAEDDLVPLLSEVARLCKVLEIPIAGVISDGQRSIRNAVARALPGVPHQLCQFHYFREAAKLMADADRHAKKELKKRVRGVRPIERSLEERTDAEAEVIRGYGLAVRSALTDDGQAPLDAAGLRLQERLQAISTSISRIEEKRGFRQNSPNCDGSSREGERRPNCYGLRSNMPIAGSIKQPICLPTQNSSRKRASSCSMSSFSRRCLSNKNVWAISPQRCTIFVKSPPAIGVGCSLAIPSRNCHVPTMDWSSTLERLAMRSGV